jgi:hypothetical protein
MADFNLAKIADLPVDLFIGGASVGRTAAVSTSSTRPPVR